MVIRSQDVDPAVLSTIVEQMRAVSAKRDPTDMERRAIAAEDARYQAIGRTWSQTDREVAGRILAGLTVAIGFLAAVTVAMIVQGAAAWAWLPGTLGGIAAGIAGVWRSVRSRRAGRAAEEQDRIHHDLLANWLPVLTLSRLERTYCEALQVLANDRSALDERTGREILGQLNALIERSREIGARRASVIAALENGEDARIEAERADLAKRAGAASDPIARQALENSLQMCDARISNLGKLKPALERLEAQQEVILQTMASVQSSLARWQAAPSVSDLPDLGQIQQAVVQIDDETYAAEQAVQEVMTG